MTNNGITHFTVKTESRRRILGIWFTKKRTYLVPMPDLYQVEQRALAWTTQALAAA